MIHPIKQSGKKDKRYSITQEYTGNYNNIGRPDYVCRFCDDWLSSHTRLDDAKEALQKFHEKRKVDMLCS